MGLFFGPTTISVHRHNLPGSRNAATQFNRHTLATAPQATITAASTASCPYLVRERTRNTAKRPEATHNETLATSRFPAILPRPQNPPRGFLNRVSLVRFQPRALKALVTAATRMGSHAYGHLVWLLLARARGHDASAGATHLWIRRRAGCRRGRTSTSSASVAAARNTSRSQCRPDDQSRSVSRATMMKPIVAASTPLRMEIGHLKEATLPA